MAGKLISIARLAAVSAYLLAVCPGTGAWIVCTNGGEKELYSAVRGCCACCDANRAPHHHERSEHHGASVEGCQGCTDTPLLIPEQTLTRTLTVPTLHLHLDVLPTLLVQPNVVTPDVNNRQRIWAESLCLDEHRVISTVVLLC